MAHSSDNRLINSVGLGLGILAFFGLTSAHLGWWYAPKVEPSQDPKPETTPAQKNPEQFGSMADRPRGEPMPPATVQLTPVVAGELLRPNLPNGWFEQSWKVAGTEPPITGRLRLAINGSFARATWINDRYQVTDPTSQGTVDGQTVRLYYHYEIDGRRTRPNSALAEGRFEPTAKPNEWKVAWRFYQDGNFVNQAEPTLVAINPLKPQDLTVKVELPEDSPSTTRVRVVLQDEIGQMTLYDQPRRPGEAIDVQAHAILPGSFQVYFDEELVKQITTP